eukprot:5815001-Pyramimonas_sp.AAC.1
MDGVCRSWWRERIRAAPCGWELPYGATKRVRGLPVAGTHADGTMWALGGAPNGATKRVRGLPTWWRGRMRAAPCGPWVELPMGPRNV